MRTTLNELNYEGRAGVIINFAGLVTAGLGQAQNVVNDIIVSGERILTTSDELGYDMTVAGLGAFAVGSVLFFHGWHRSSHQELTPFRLPEQGE